MNSSTRSWWQGLQYSLLWRWLGSRGLQPRQRRPVWRMAGDALLTGVVRRGVDPPEPSPRAGRVLQLDVAPEAQGPGPVDRQLRRVLRMVGPGAVAVLALDGHVRRPVPGVHLLLMTRHAGRFALVLDREPLPVADARLAVPAVRVAVPRGRRSRPARRSAGPRAGRATRATTTSTGLHTWRLKRRASGYGVRSGRRLAGPPGAGTAARPRWAPWSAPWPPLARRRRRSLRRAQVRTGSVTFDRVPSQNQAGAKVKGIARYSCVPSRRVGPAAGVVGRRRVPPGA